MDEKDVFPAMLELELAQGLKEWQALDVPRCAANLGDEDIGAFAALEDATLDLVGHVRDNLDGGSEIISVALLGDDGLIDLAGCQTVGTAKRAGGEALVMAEVEVGLSAVVEHVNLTVLVGVHRPRIHVEVGVEFLDSYREAPRFEQRAERASCEALAEGGDHTASDKDVFHEIWEGMKKKRVVSWDGGVRVGQNHPAEKLKSEGI